MSKEEMIATIQGCAEKLGHAPTARELQSMTGLTKKKVMQRFGSYTLGLSASGLAREDKARPHSAMEVFLAWATLTRKLQRIPKAFEFAAESPMTEGCLIRRFQRWGLVPMGMRRFMEQEGLEAEWGDVREIIKNYMSSPATVMRWMSRFEPVPIAGPIKESNGGPISGLATDPLRDRPDYGLPIANPAMVNAPTNENGVMVLFGSLAPELGFIVTRVQSAFPDGEALRRMKDGRCQRVLFEFEFESRNFSLHMHDPKGCDLIVCWIHNWKDCPLEVIELSRYVGSALQRVSAQAAGV